MTQGMSYPHAVSHQLQPTGTVDQFALQQQQQQHQQHQQHQQAQTTHVPYSNPQQQSHTSKQERPKSKIVIRDPNQGGKDITNEILNRNKTSPPTATTSATSTAATAATTTGSDSQPTRHDLAIREEFMAQVSERKNTSKPNAKAEDGKENGSQEERNEVNAKEIYIQSNEEKINPDLSENRDSQENVREESPATDKESLVPDKENKPLDNTETLQVANVDEIIRNESEVSSNEEPDGDVSSTIKSEDADELNKMHTEENEQPIEVAPHANEEEKESCQEAASEVRVESEPIVLNDTKEKHDSTQEGSVETQDSQGNTVEASQNDKIEEEEDVTASPVSNDLEKPVQNTSSQGRNITSSLFVYSQATATTKLYI